jgi:uncharacterized membrane protein
MDAVSLAVLAWAAVGSVAAIAFSIWLIVAAIKSIGNREDE